MLNGIKKFVEEIKNEVKEEMNKQERIPIEISSKYNIEELKENAPYIHPVSIFELSIKLWKEDKKEEALFWYYIGSLRYRIRLDVIENTEKFENEIYYFEKMEFETKPIFLEWAGGDPLYWSKAIEDGIKWDQKNINAYTNKEIYKDIYQENIKRSEDLSILLIEQKDDILKNRKKQGLENRI